MVPITGLWIAKCCTRVCRIWALEPSLRAAHVTDWTLATRNLATRATIVQHFAGSNPPNPWGSNTTPTGTNSSIYDQTTAGCPGTTTNVTDEANIAHINCSDGLGRLIAVTEPDPITGAAGAVTSYTYDLLNNLIGVSISGQPNNT